MIPTGHEPEWYDSRNPALQGDSPEPTFTAIEWWGDLSLRFTIDYGNGVEDYKDVDLQPHLNLTYGVYYLVDTDVLGYDNKSIKITITELGPNDEQCTTIHIIPFSKLDL